MNFIHNVMCEKSIFPYHITDKIIEIPKPFYMNYQQLSKLRKPRNKKLTIGLKRQQLTITWFIIYKPLIISLIQTYTF